MHAVFVQYGDYADGYRRLLQEDGAETYYGQRYTVQFVSDLAQRMEVTVVSFAADQPETVLDNGVRTIGLGGWSTRAHLRLVNRVRALSPTHMIVAAPNLPLISWARRQRSMRILPLFADSFRTTSPRARVTQALLARELNHPSIEYVSNHNLAASLEVMRIGVSPSKIVPFDWPAFLTPEDHAAKTAPPKDRPLRLIYVGMVVPTKGIEELIRAVGILRNEGPGIELSVVGGTDDEHRALASDLGVGDRVHWLGRQPHDRIVPMMNEHDVVCVPSRHEYPEGLPMTIYEGLCSRSPLLVSDHPMFSLRMTGGDNCVVAKAGDAESFADGVRLLRDDDALYARLSSGAADAANGYLCPLKWDRLVTLFLDDDAGRRGELASYTLDSGRYPREALTMADFVPRNVFSDLVETVTTRIRNHFD